MKFLILKVWWLTLFAILTGWGDSQIVGETLLKYFWKCLWGYFWRIGVWLTRLKRSALNNMNLHDPTIGELHTTERKRKGEFSLSLLQLRCPSFLPSVIKALGSQAFGFRLWITPRAPLVFRPLDLNYTTSFSLSLVCRQTVKFMYSITTWTNSYNKSPHI